MKFLNREPKPKRKLTKEDIIGLVFGISFVRAIGFAGFFPYIIGIFFGSWLARKMLNGQLYLKIIFWVLFVAVFFISVMAYGARNPEYYYK